MQSSYIDLSSPQDPFSNPQGIDNCSRAGDSRSVFTHNSQKIHKLLNTRKHRSLFTHKGDKGDVKFPICV